MATVRQLSRRVVVVLFVICIPFGAFAQFVGRNINMVSGTQLPDGDPYLQRQNEPSMSVSTRNPLHILAGANDYRTVDIPGLPDGETGDAWLGVFKSTDGGLTWRSTLVPGYPQDVSPQAGSSPIRGFQAAADPMVRSGLNGMFYYSGIALNRTSPIVSSVFVARYNDANNRESGDPFQYIGTSLVADGRQGPRFLDKPSLAVDIPRPGAQLCSVNGQFFTGGNVYVVYTEITSHVDAATHATVTDGAKLWLSRSVDCGATWSAPIAISGNNTLSQGSVVAVDTWSGTVHVVWRRFATITQSDAIMASKSTDGGKTFSVPVVVRNIVPFEQGTKETRFRTSAYPTAVTDADGRLYVAWPERTGPSGSQPGTQRLDGRIMLSSSADGASWTAPVMVAPTSPASPLSGRGHQFMPALSYASGKLMLVHYDMREDSTVGEYHWSTLNPFFSETRILSGDLAHAPTPIIDNVFNDFIEDAGFFGNPLQRRHTVDLRVSQASPGVMPLFQASQRVSSYRFGYTSQENTIRQREFNPPNYKMFMKGTVPFFGDYIDIAPQYPFVSSLINLPLPAPVFHAVWTDNRDVHPPILPYTWADFAPPGSTGARSGFDPTQFTTQCVPGNTLAAPPPTGTRNQNIYTSRITSGLFFGSPGNDKPLGQIQRAFVVTVQNSKSVAQSYRLQIVNQPFGGKASFQQLPAAAPALTTLDITVNARSSGSRSVFVTSNIKNAPVGVTITEIGTAGGTPQPNALTSAVVLNPDPSSPDIGSTNPGTPDIGTAEVYTPDIGTPDIGTPDIGTPDIGTPDIGTPDIGTPDIGTPDIGTPDIGTPTYATPDIGTPDIGTPDIGTNSVSDTTWPVTNDGNTTASYSTKLLKTGDIPDGVKLQLILHQSYRTPVDHNCVLSTETHQILLNNVSNPPVLTSTNGIGAPDIGSPSVATVSIPPGESVNLTVRVVDPNHLHRHIPATSFLTPVIIAHAVGTADLNSGNLQPAISLVITTPIPDGVFSGPIINALSAASGSTLSTSYNITLNAIGGVPGQLGYTWSRDPETGGTLPPGLTFAGGTFPPSGGASITGTPSSVGTYTFTVRVTDSIQHSATRTYTLHITTPLIAATSLPNGVRNSRYSAKLGSTGGLAPIHWEVASGVLPAQLSLSDDGTISGTPTSAGTFTFSARLTDSSIPSQTATAPVQLTIVDPVKITTTSLPDGTVDPNSPYSVFIQTTGGTTPFTFSGSPILERLGLSLNAVTGELHGNLITAGVVDLPFSVTDSSQPASSDTKILRLRMAPPLVITTESIPNAIVNQPYSTTISATGGQPPYTWTLTKSPTELSIDSNGVISGTFAKPSSPFVNVIVTDSGSPQRTAFRQYPFSALNVAITAIAPSTAVAGFGQMVAIDVVGLTSLTNVVAEFTDASKTEHGFIFGGASTPSRLFVRLPFFGDGFSAANLTPGPITVALVTGTTTLATHAMTLSPDVPGTPTILNLYGLTTPPDANNPCGSGLGTTPLTSVSPGQGVAVSALGVDTTGASLHFAQAGKDVLTSATTCAISGSGIGVAPIFPVPGGLSAGPVDVSISVLVGNLSSAWSAPVTLQVVVPSTNVNVTPATAGTFVQGQSFNETRLAEVLVEGTGPVNVSSMTLAGLNAASPALVGARIYDANWGVVATADNGNVAAGTNQTITIPIVATLTAGATYRVGFFVQTSTGNGGSGTFLQPSSGAAYEGSPTGWLQIQRAWSFPTDSPANQVVNSFVPQVTISMAR